MTDSPVGLKEFNRIVRITLLVPVTVLAILAGLLVWQVQLTLDLRHHARVDSRVIEQVLLLEDRVLEQETGLRG
jgi:CHASE3 domain sensor protein